LLFWLCASWASAAADPRAQLESAYRDYRSAVARSSFAEARPHAVRALEVGRVLYGAEHETTALLELNLGDLELQLAHLEAAEPLYARALATLEKLKGPRSPALLVPLTDLAEIHARAQRFAEARRYQERALGVIEAAYGADHPATAHRLVAVGILADAAGDPGGARPRYERALLIRRKLFASVHPDVAECLYLLARLELRSGSDERARALYQDALAIWQKHPPADGRALAAAESQLSSLEARLAEARLERVPEETPAQPIARPAPEYPAAALRKGLEGWVRLSFTVGVDGRVKSPVVVEAQPARVFDRAALAALATWRYEPRRVNGQPAEQPRTEVVLRFALPEHVRARE
jgi:TonB family protein